MWGIFDDRLECVCAQEVFRLSAALDEGDVSTAWAAWSAAADSAQVDAHLSSGVPVPDRGLKAGRDCKVS